MTMISSILQLPSYEGVYLLLYAWLFGMSVWITFFGGVIAFRVLRTTIVEAYHINRYSPLCYTARAQFGALQHKIFPIYFLISIFGSASMLGYWLLWHKHIVADRWRLNAAEVAQAYALVTVLAAQGLNYFVVGPLTSRTMFQRHKQEKEEGKTYNEPGVSSQMKSLNVKFGVLHGLSSLANLSAVIALTYHGLWLGKFGIH